MREPSRGRRRTPAWLPIGVVVALAFGIGAYFGSAQVAGSASTPPPRTVSLRLGDTALLGHLQCVAASDSRRYPMNPGAYYLRCSKRPEKQARYVVFVFPDGAAVAQAGTYDPLYQTPR